MEILLSRDITCIARDISYLSTGMRINNEQPETLWPWSLSMNLDS